MEIEKEIHQKKFKSEYQKLVINILFTSKWLDGRQAAMFKGEGISPQQFNLLRILRGRQPEPATVQYIMERMMDKNSNASRLIDKLCAKGLTERHECPTNRRAVDVRITEDGLALLKRLDKEVDSWDNHERNLSIDEAKVMNGLLDKLRG